jgi:hypothetical protein
VTALSGANTANPTSNQGGFANPAAPAVRDPYSVHWFDLDLSAGISFPGSFGRSDFQNRGTRARSSSLDRTRQFLNLDGSLTAQFGHFGITAETNLFRYEVDLPEGTSVRPGVAVTFTRYELLASYGFFDGQLLLGGGVRALSTGLQQFGGGQPTRNVLTFLGFAPEVGMVLKPNGSQVNFGAAFRAGISAAPVLENTAVSGGVQKVGSFVSPAVVTAPWELEIGGAFQLGPRPLNPRWINPREDEAPLKDRIRSARLQRLQAGVTKSDDDAIRKIEDEELRFKSEELAESRRKRDANWPREKLLILASVLVTGPSNAAVSVIGFTDQERDLVGRSVNLSPRIGLEAEPVLDRLKLRFGSYLEPSRYADGNLRQHFTFGTEVKLFSFKKWWFLPDLDICAQGAVDIAPRYLNIGGFFCVWH